MIYTQIEQLIGNTPLLRLDSTRWGLVHTDLYLKLEYLNPFGSIKDRTAMGITNDIDMTALAAHDQKLLESSSGNTAKALQLLAGRHGTTLTSVTNRIKVPEVEQQLRYLGTEIIALPGRSECPDPQDEGNPLNVIHRMQSEQPTTYHHTRQYENRENPAIHRETTAREVHDDLGEVDAVVTGVGTGGSSGGFIEFARQHALDTRCVGVMADPSDFLPGIRTRNELFETALFREDDYHELVEVSSAEALTALRRLVVEEGVLAGPTTGANFHAMLRYARQHDALREDGTRRVVVGIACDRLEPYMSYIMKRQPELFGEVNQHDIYRVRLTDAERVELERPAAGTTLRWVDEVDAQVIDTRGVRPYVNFRIPRSLNIPEEYLREMLESGTPFPASRPLLFVCPTGERSALFAKILRERQYEAYSVAGGLAAWRTAGLPLERGPRGAQ